VKHLKAKVRRAYNRGKLGERYQAELKRLSKKLLKEKSLAQETFLSSVQNESIAWAGSYRYVNRRKGNKESIPISKDRRRSHIRSDRKSKFLK
jgi:hypothetical protein